MTADDKIKAACAEMRAVSDASAIEAFINGRPASEAVAEIMNDQTLFPGCRMRCDGVTVTIDGKRIPNVTIIREADGSIVMQRK